ncbi:MAG: rRNA maturation RNase YbeY [Candidatus Kapaibacteriales bacterium]
MANIFVFNDTNYKRLPRKLLIDTVEQVMNYFNKKKFSVIFIYTTRNEILRLNRKFLNHNYITDVITFDLSDNDYFLIGEIYICVSQAKKQAKEYCVSLSAELRRLAVHGVLHLLGFDDSNSNERENMHKLENKFLDKRGDDGKVG